ncbi:MAG: hypothetical protein RLZZ58_1961, partial [Pseudomonadota bacterium]
MAKLTDLVRGSRGRAADAAERAADAARET